MEITVNIEENIEVFEYFASIERLVKTSESPSSSYVSMEDFYKLLNLSIKVLSRIEKRGLTPEKLQFINQIEDSRSENYK